MKIEMKLNIATVLVVIVFGYALCASAVTADWDAVKRLVGDAASSGSNNVSVTVGNLPYMTYNIDDYGVIKIVPAHYDGMPSKIDFTDYGGADLPYFQAIGGSIDGTLNVHVGDDHYTGINGGSISVYDGTTTTDIQGGSVVVYGTNSNSAELDADGLTLNDHNDQTTYSRSAIAYNNVGFSFPNRDGTFALDDGISLSAMLDQSTASDLATNPAFSNAVLLVGIDTNILATVAASTNAVAQIGNFFAAFADIGITPTQGGMTLAGLLAALVAAVTWLKRNKITEPSGKAAGKLLKVGTDGTTLEWGDGGGGGGSQGYAFVDLTPTTQSGYKVFSAQDHAINRFTLADETPVKVVLPNATDANCRDLVIKVNVTSATMPTFEIVPPSDATSVGIEASDDGWADLEAGINYFTITETDRA